MAESAAPPAEEADEEALRYVLSEEENQTLVAVHYNKILPLYLAVGDYQNRLLGRQLLTRLLLVPSTLLTSAELGFGVRWSADAPSLQDLPECEPFTDDSQHVAGFIALQLEKFTERNHILDWYASERWRMQQLFNAPPASWKWNITYAVSLIRSQPTLPVTTRMLQRKGKPVFGAPLMANSVPSSGGKRGKLYSDILEWLKAPHLPANIADQPEKVPRIQVCVRSSLR